jgi:drug/metabolite transporter (DMT)-like permease
MAGDYERLSTIEEGEAKEMSQLPSRTGTDLESQTRGSSDGQSLPGTDAPAVPASSRSSTIQTAAYIVVWIMSSNFTILFNKWLIDTAGFRYPILLTCWHLTFAALVTQILARTTRLLDSRHSLPISGRFYLRTVLPIGVVASASLICGNVVYLYLSVAFIQMLKASSPAAVLLVSVLMGVAKPTTSAVVNIMVIVGGVALASAGSIEFSWIGFGFQLAGVIFEAIRVVLIQVMLSSEGLKMDALVGLYYYAPACAAMNFLVACFFELPKFQVADLVNVGPLVLILNAAVAFLLNFASMALIGRTSGLVTTLTGIFKNILLIVASVVLWGTPISTLQVIGYGIGLAGLIYYSFGYEKIAAGCVVTGTWISSLFGGNGGKVSPRIRVAIFIGVMGLLSVLIAVSYFQGYGKSMINAVWSSLNG